MKRLLLWWMSLLLLAAPLFALAEGEIEGDVPTEPPAAVEALSIDTATVYDGMAKNYGKGYVPTVKDNAATIVLPLLGNTKDQTIRVTPQLSADGPYVYGNYQFDVKKRSVTASDGGAHDVFLIVLDLPLNAVRYNGTYPIPFTVDYVTTDGAPMQQTFTVQLTIAAGKTKSEGGSSGPSSVRKPVILAESCVLSPSEVAGGDAFSVQLTLKNVGNRDAKNIRVAVTPESEALQLKDDLNAQFVDYLKVNTTTEATFELTVLPGAPEGVALIGTLISYEDKYGGSYTEEGHYRVFVTQPKIEIASAEWSSETVNGGEDFSVTMTLKNTGSREAEDISVRFLPQEESIRSKGIRDVRTIALIEKGGSETISFELRVLPSASEGAHTLAFALSYSDPVSGGRYETQTEYSIVVLQKPQLGYDEVRLPETIVSGESFTLPVCVYNTGFTPLFNVRCALSCDGLISSSAFLGNLQPQQSEDKTITVFATTLSGSQKYGETYGSMEITYEDAEGEQHYESVSLRMTIQEPQKQTDEEKEREQKKIEEQKTLSQWWVSLLIGIAAIALLVSMIVIGKFSRMMRMK